MHVSATPPAFALSQDQTLQLESWSQDTTRVECVSCLSTHHLAIPTASSRDRLTSTRTLRRSRAEPPGGHTPALLGLELFTCQRANGAQKPPDPHILPSADRLSIPRGGRFHFFGTPRREPRTEFLEWRTTHTPINSIPCAPPMSSTIFAFPRRMPGRHSTPHRVLSGRRGAPLSQSSPTRAPFI